MRTLEQIHQEYMNVCAQLGDVHYRYGQMPYQMDELEDKLKELNFEADEVKKAKAIADANTESKNV